MENVLYIRSEQAVYPVRAKDGVWPIPDPCYLVDVSVPIYFGNIDDESKSRLVGTIEGILLLGRDAARNKIDMVNLLDSIDAGYGEAYYRLQEELSIKDGDGITVCLIDSVVGSSGYTL